jgi:hypothetical protein
MKRVLIALALSGATLSIIPTAAAQEPATVTTVCTEFGTALLTPPPPPKKGATMGTVFVPGPCHAPGFVLVAGS